MKRTAPSTDSGRNRRIIPWALFLLAILSIIGFRHLLLYRIAELFVVHHGLKKADVIYLLNGEHETRPFIAADLYRKGFAPRIWVAQTESDPAEKLGLVPNDTAINVGVLKKLGVPEDRIAIIPFPNGVSSTWEEAIALRRFVNDHPVESILVLTSSLHTRRAYWAFQKIFAGSATRIRMAEAPHWGFDQTNWWRSEQGVLTIVSETVKLLYYWSNHRDSGS
ncbi:YdcF family protein [Desulfatirhabdium butyrativorans]|uniref:YdcF family protein n=1 Tax=Desulfatirhabdium butyrativorans TaxID=340467 RepID=UPI000404E93F|nr:YdcF family protein [Desulfatirhabdium butyrativorans]